MEQAIISGVAHDKSEAKVTIVGVPDRTGIAALIFQAIADNDINVDMIVQNVGDQGSTDISFTVPREDLVAATAVCEQMAVDMGFEAVTTDNTIGRVSVVGAGMASNPGVAATMLEVLAANGINIGMISTSAIRISCVVAEADVDRATVALHTAFGLDAGR